MSRELYEERLEKAGSLLSDALDIYQSLWDLFPERREELTKKSLFIIELFEKTLKRRIAEEVKA